MRVGDLGHLTIVALEDASGSCTDRSSNGWTTADVRSSVDDAAGRGVIAGDVACSHRCEVGLVGVAGVGGELGEPAAPVGGEPDEPLQASDPGVVRRAVADGVRRSGAGTGATTRRTRRRPGRACRSDVATVRAARRRRSSARSRRRRRRLPTNVSREWRRAAASAGSLTARRRGPVRSGRTAPSPRRTRRSTSSAAARPRAKPLAPGRKRTPVVAVPGGRSNDQPVVSGPHTQIPRPSIHSSSTDPSGTRSWRPSGRCVPRALDHCPQVGWRTDRAEPRHRLMMPDQR